MRYFIVSGFMSLVIFIVLVFLAHVALGASTKGCDGLQVLAINIANSDHKLEAGRMFDCYYLEAFVKESKLYTDEEIQYYVNLSNQ